MSATDVLLVHGAFHGAWCWEPLIRVLAARGVGARAIDLPGHGASPEPLAGLDASVARVERELEAGPAPSIVCAHSFGGAPVTSAVRPDHGVARLVYLAAYAPVSGESAEQTLAELQSSAIGEAVRPDPEGNLTIDPERAIEFFYHDCDPAEARRAASLLGPEHPDSFRGPARRTAWREVRSTYVLCSQDRVLPPDLQERLAAGFEHRMHLPSGHSPMLSMPDRLADLLISLLSDVA